MKLRLIAAAKINWTLEALGRRDDGYHEIRTILQTVALHDNLVLSSAEALELRLTGAPPSQDWSPEDDLAYRAAQALREEAGNPSLGALIELEKAGARGRRPGRRQQRRCRGAPRPEPSLETRLRRGALSPHRRLAWQRRSVLLDGRHRHGRRPRRRTRRPSGRSVHASAYRRPPRPAAAQDRPHVPSSFVRSTTPPAGAPSGWSRSSKSGAAISDDAVFNVF